MGRRSWFALFLIAMLTVAAACGDDDDGDAAASGHSHEITATGLWARQTAGVEGESAAIYGTLKNGQHEDDTLLEIRVPADIGRAAMLHATVQEGQTMSMVEQTDFVLAADAQLELAPGGMHVMVMGLSERLVEDDEFAVTFVFEHAGEVTATVEVRAVDGN
jgi:copper(I)-binding protein